MVIQKPTSNRAFAIMEIVLAAGILGSVLIPLAFSIIAEQKLCRAYYFQAIALEIVDGEMEILAAGEWKKFKEGAQDYPVRGRAVTNLPPGHFVLTLGPRELELSWTAAKRSKGGRVTRKIRRDTL